MHATCMQRGEEVFECTKLRACKSIKTLLSTGFKLVKQNWFAKISEHSKEKDPPQPKKFLDLQIILWKIRGVLTKFCEAIWLSFAN